MATSTSEFGSPTPSPPGSPLSSRSSSSAMSAQGPLTPLNLYQNTADPAATWLVQKYGGTSVGKFAVKIAEEIVPAYIDQHKIVVVCSARSGSTKALGTTNLLLRAASEALQRNAPSPTPGFSTPQVPSATFGVAHSKGFWSRKESVSSTNGAGPVNGASSRSRSRPETPTSARSSSASPSPFASSLSMTNLSQAVNQSSSSQNNSAVPQPFHATVDLLRLDHLTAARSSVRDPELLRELETEIERDCEGLRSFLFAAQIIDEISPRSRDIIVGFGERLSCKLVAAILRDRGIDAEFVSLENILPAVDSTSALDDDVSRSEVGSLDQTFYDRVATVVGERIKQCGNRVPVVTGFFGPVPGSLLRQVGRGYTDLLAALASVGLNASELQIWKEVDGIFSADPRKVPTARLLPIISPDEAAELTYYGSEVVHPFTMEQVIRRKIPIRIKNVENPLGGGTVIHPDPDTDGVGLNVDMIQDPTIDIDPVLALQAKRKKLPTAVTIKERITVLNVHSNRKSVSHGFFARIFGTLDRFGVVVDLISTSEVHVSMAIEDNLGKRMLDRLVKELEKSGTVSVHPDMAILSLVGKQMRNLVGIAGRMFTTLADGNVNIEMISQGASEINISCVIDGRDAVKALNLIHQSCLQIVPEGTLGRVGPWLF